jgi:AcrR family transcriptional regulator
MIATMPSRKLSPPTQTAPARARVRRGSEEDADRLRDELLGAALALFLEGGLDAVTMRAVATQVGVSAMTPYRYFEDKSHLLRGIWHHVVQAAAQAMREASTGVADARDRIRTQVNAFIDYWEAHPQHYRLVYMTEQTTRRDEQGMLTSSPTYSGILEASLDASRRFAEEIGGDPAHAKLASDVRFLMLSGYLQARLVNQRYPWSPVDVLRPTFIELILEAMANCLRHGPRQAPAAVRRVARPRTAQKS